MSLTGTPSDLAAGDNRIRSFDDVDNQGGTVITIGGCFFALNQKSKDLTLIRKGLDRLGDMHQLHDRRTIFIQTTGVTREIFRWKDGYLTSIYQWSPGNAPIPYVIFQDAITGTFITTNTNAASVVHKLNDLTMTLDAVLTTGFEWNNYARSRSGQLFLSSDSITCQGVMEWIGDKFSKVYEFGYGWKYLYDRAAFPILSTDRDDGGLIWSPEENGLIPNIRLDPDYSGSPVWFNTTGVTKQGCTKLWNYCRLHIELENLFDVKAVVGGGNRFVIPEAGGNPTRVLVGTMQTETSL
jgi:hypothetical protein